MKLNEITSFFSLRTIKEWNTNEITKKRNTLLYFHKLIKEGSIDSCLLLFFEKTKIFSKDLLHAKKYLENKIGEDFEEAYQLASFNLKEEEIDALIFLTTKKFFS